MQKMLVPVASDTGPHHDATSVYDMRHRRAACSAPRREAALSNEAEHDITTRKVTTLIMPDLTPTYDTAR